jgi:WD40 repeat protein
MVGHQDSVHSAVFSPDDSRIVSSSRDTTIRVWDALTRKEVFPAICGHDSFVFSVAFSPDGTPVVSGSTNNIIRIWDALSGAEIVTAVHDHQDLFFSVMLSPDGTRVIAHSSDGTDIGWDAASGIQLFAVSSNPTTISTPRLFSPRTIEVNSDGWLVHVPTNRTVSKLPTILTPLCSASHGTSLAIGTQGGQVIIMTFPLAVFTRSETRPAPGRGRQRRELQYDSLA